MNALSNDEFFAKLAELFDGRKGKDHGSIQLTQKRLSYNQDISATTDDGISPDLHPTKPLPILIRVTDGKGREQRKERVKLSTVVEADSLASFFDRYADICKAGMTTLKPRDRSKRKTKGKKKKGGAAPATMT